jgi:hypothetical protein
MLPDMNVTNSILKKACKILLAVMLMAVASAANAQKQSTGELLLSLGVNHLQQKASEKTAQQGELEIGEVIRQWNRNQPALNWAGRTFEPRVTVSGMNNATITRDWVQGLTAALFTQVGGEATMTAAEIAKRSRELDQLSRNKWVDQSTLQTGKIKVGEFMATVTVTMIRSQTAFNAFYGKGGLVGRSFGFGAGGRQSKSWCGITMTIADRTGVVKTSIKAMANGHSNEWNGQINGSLARLLGGTQIRLNTTANEQWLNDAKATENAFAMLAREMTAEKTVK